MYAVQSKQKSTVAQMKRNVCCSAGFHPAPANRGISTMDWAIASCCREGVPDVIFRQGSSAAESRIVLLGERPADVANNIIICSNRILNSAL